MITDYITQNLKPILFSLTLLSMIGLCAPLSATETLTFERYRVNELVSPEAKDITIPFKFSNTTKKPITIARVDSVCSCLHSKIKEQKMTYQPGEKGQIEIKFKLGKFSGDVNKSMLLWTTEDDPKVPSVILEIHVTIPDLIKIEPVTTLWERDEALLTKKVKLTVAHKTPIHITSHSSMSSNFTCKLVTISPGREYEMHITPKNTSHASYGIFKIKTDSKIPSSRSMLVFSRVKK